MCAPCVVSVTPGANRAQVVKTCLTHSSLWHTFTQRSLSCNMRVRASGDPVLESFDQWSVNIGNGEANNVNGQVGIPCDALTIYTAFPTWNTRLALHT